MTEVKNFRDKVRDISPPWLRRGTAEKILFSVGLQLDILRDLTVSAVQLRFPGYFSSESLPYLSRDRRISRGRYETNKGFANRLLSWLDDHLTRGNPYALLRQLHAHFAPNNFKIELIYALGTRFTLDVDGTITVDEVTWTPPGKPVATHPARWWLFYHAPQFAIPALWDEPGNTWNNGQVWNSGLSAADVADLRLVPDAWNTAAAIGHIVLLDEGDEWDSHTPGLWPYQIELRKHMPTAPLTPVEQDDLDAVIPPEAGSPVIAEVVRAGFQSIVNTLAWLRRDVGELDPLTARLQIDGALVADGADFSFSDPSAGTFLDDGYTIAAGDQGITLPSPGRYLITVNMTVVEQSTAADPSCWVTLRYDGFNLQGFPQKRIGSTNTTHCHISGSCVLDIFNWTNVKALSLRNTSDDPSALTIITGAISITRLKDTTA